MNVPMGITVVIKMLLAQIRLGHTIAVVKQDSQGMENSFVLVSLPDKVVKGSLTTEFEYH